MRKKDKYVVSYIFLIFTNCPIDDAFKYHLYSILLIRNISYMYKVEKLYKYLLMCLLYILQQPFYVPEVWCFWFVLLILSGIIPRLVPILIIRDVSFNPNLMLFLGESQLFFAVRPSLTNK